MDEAASDFNENAKRLSELRNEYTTMEHNLTVGLNDLQQLELEDVHKLEQKLRKMEESNDSETAAVRQQVAVVGQLRDQIKKSIFALNSRIEASEVDVGYE